MMAKNRDALTCDMAETYGVFDIQALPVPLLATLAVGLRDDSRIKKLMADTALTTTEQLLALVVDKLSNLIWMISDKGRKGEDPPKSVYLYLMGEERETNGEVISFTSPEEYESAWAQITGVKHHG